MYEEEYYQCAFESNYSSYQNHPYNKALLNLILKDKQNGKLLEIGCAYGYFLKEAEIHFKTIGIDVSEHAIEQAKKNTHTTKLLLGDVESILDSSEENHQFDVIVALDVLEHLPDPKQTLRKLADCLKTDGYLIFRVPNTECVDFKFYSLINEKEKWHGLKDKTHISLLALIEWGNIVESIGFEYHLIPTIPMRFLKNIVMSHFPDKFFQPNLSILIKTNKSITFMCKKCTDIV